MSPVRSASAVGSCANQACRKANKSCRAAPPPDWSKSAAQQGVRQSPGGWTPTPGRAKRGLAPAQPPGAASEQVLPAQQAPGEPAQGPDGSCSSSTSFQPLSTPRLPVTPSPTESTQSPSAAVPPKPVA